MFGTLERGISAFLVAGLTFFGSLPATTTYQLQSYGFGSGGTANSATSTYALEGMTGEISGAPNATTTYAVNNGFVSTQQANVPTIVLSNPNNYYDKLTFVINTQNNPSSATYALEVSTTSNFASSNSFVQPDNTLNSTLTLSDYQTYTAWGGATGANIIGLSNNTTYYIRAKASNGKFTESAYGPSSNAATIGQQLSYCIYTNANCAAGGNSISFGALTAGNITSSPNNIGVNFATNANSGGNVYISSQNGGFKSTSASYNLTSATADLSSVSSGYGGQVGSASQTSGGPFSSTSPYNLASNNVGALSANIAKILSSSNPVVGGVGVIGLKVLPSSITPEATDYSDTLTLLTAASF